jgi:SAM-dependent methyltransferase
VLVCKVCGNDSQKKTFTAREMMFGTRDEFLYFECPCCGCVQLADIPEDLSAYYPDIYYSHAKPKHDKTNNSFKKFYKSRWYLHSIGKKNIVGALRSYFHGAPEFSEWFRKLGIDFNASILDVGCGSGSLLVNIWQCGFENSHGVDPFLPEDIYYKGGLHIEARDISELSGQYDYIMLHHSFEHMPEPVKTFETLYMMLTQRGKLLVRIPVADSFAWREYRENWVQLDPPRHLFLHTEKSMRALASKAGFEIESIVYDSTDFQFWGSEEYRKGIARYAKNSYTVDPEGSIFSRADIKEFRKRAEQLNAQQDGDQACYYFIRR